MNKECIKENLSENLNRISTANGTQIWETVKEISERLIELFLVQNCYQFSCLILYTSVTPKRILKFRSCVH